MPALQTSPSNDAHLLGRFTRDHDEEAFAALMRRHWGFVYSIARASLNDSALAEDATQQTFIALSKRAHKFSKNTPLAPWLYRAVRHESSNLRRREQRLKKRNQEYTSLSLSSTGPSSTNLSAQLHRALATLPEKDRQLIILRYYQNLTAEQIATQLRISPAAAQRRTHRALEKLSTLTNKQNQDQKSFGQALPALLSPEILPTKSSLTKILNSSTTATSSLLLPAAGWLLATTLSVSAVKQISPKSTPPSPQQNTTQTVSSNRILQNHTPTPPLPEDPQLAQFITLARTSPDEAFTWCKTQFPRLTKETNFLKKAARYLAKNDPPLAKTLLASREARHYREPLIAAILHASAATSDLPAAILWLESLPTIDHRACNTFLFQQREQTEYIDQFHEALAVSTKPVVRSFLAGNIFDYYQETDETKIIDFARSLDEQTQNEVLSQLARIQLDRDHPMANDLIHELKGEVHIDPAKVSLRNPARFLNASLPYIESYNDRWACARFLIKDWFDLDPEGVTTWVAKNDPNNILKLSPHQRTR